MNLIFRTLISLGMLASLSLPSMAADAAKEEFALVIENPRIEAVTNPLATDVANPRLSWTFSSTQQGDAPSAIQVQVATTEKNLADGKADLWDSGKIAGGDMHGAIYAGRDLKPGERAFWRVKAWDKNGRETAWSSPASWALGISDSKDWRAEWIGYANEREPIGSLDAPVWNFRRDFEIGKRPERAVLYLAVAGIAEAWINGKKVGDGVLQPALTDLRVRVPYRAYDVSGMLREGKNTLGIRLGNGFVNMRSHLLWDLHTWPMSMPPRFLASLQEFNGAELTTLVASSGEWEKSRSDVTFNCNFGGEFIDARLRIPDWSLPERKAAGEWSAALPLDAPAGSLSALMMPVTRVTEDIQPVSIKEVKPDVYLVDMGVNFTGWIRFRGEGKAGQLVRITMGERLNPDGTLDTKDINPVTDGRPFDANAATWAELQQAGDSKKGPFHEQRLTFSGKGREEFEPQFTFQSGQYVLIEGLGYLPAKEDVTGRAVQTDFAQTGEFSSSSALLNQLCVNFKRVHRNNWLGIRVDCPHREKTQWLGDPNLAAMLYFFDMQPIYSKVLNDDHDNQKIKGGSALEVWAPSKHEKDPKMIDVAGQGEIWRLPWTLYLFSGDRRYLERGFGPMKAFMTHLLEVYPDGFTPISEISTTAPYGEHRGEGYFEARNAWDLAIKAGIPREEANKLFRTPHDLLGAMQTYEGLLTIIKVARVLGEEQDVKTYEAIAARVGKRINSHMDEATGAYAKDSQSLQVLALANNIPRQEHHAKVLDYLKRNIVETRKGHFSVGATQLREFFRVLSKEGEGALAVKVMHQPGAPGFVDMLSHGLTAVWERWDGKGSFNSHDYATVADWFFADLAGIQPDPQLPGFKRIVFKPDLACGLESASADYESVRGRIVSDWKIENGRIVYDILVPPGCEGKVLLPASADIVSPPDATRKGQENGHAVFLTGSGKFRFEIPVSDNK